MEKNLNLVVAAYLLNSKKRRHGVRRFNVHPIVAKRLFKGEFVSLFSDLQEDEMKLFMYFKMSIRTFEELHSKLESSMIYCDMYKKPISSRERLAVTIKYLTTGSRMSELHLTYRLGQSTIKNIIEEVCSLIWTLLRNECLPEPDQNYWNNIAFGFERDANFPNCIGALDGKHTRITCPTGSGSVFFNHKQFYSIILLAMCDANYCFTYVNVGACGSEADSNVLKKSSIFHRLERNDLHIPPPKLLPRTLINPQPHVIVADAAFGISNSILRPYARKNLTHKKKIVNYRLSRARRYIESTFGILANKFAIFQRSINVKTSFAQILVKACCILHNFIRVRDGYQEEDTMIIVGLTEYDSGVNTRSGNTIRDEFANYFDSDEGSVPWQNNYIH